MAVEVRITVDANAELEAVPLPIQQRIASIFERLANWPAVSGAKPLRGDLQGSYRIRTGDFRVVFKPSADGRVVIVWKIGNRGDVYE
jgi:mRNA interferase RelE/StbE